MSRVPPKGYFLEPTNSILVVSMHNVTWVEHLLQGRVLTFVKWSRYLGGYIGDTGTQVGWLSHKVQYWACGVKTMAGVLCKQLQAAYMGLQKSLQQEWTFVNCET